MIEINNIIIKEIASCVPQKTVENMDVPGFTEEKKRKISESAGIKTRHISEKNQCTSDFCFEAASQVLCSSGIDPAEIGVLVFASQTPDYLLPATGCVLQDRLGLSKDIIVLDINMGCSAYIYGLLLVSTLLNSTPKKYGLLVNGDTISKYVSHEDASTLFLFGDAGCATLLEKRAGTAPMIFSLGTDGSGWPNLIIPAGASRNMHSVSTKEMKTDNEGNTRSSEHLFMDGMEIFNFTISAVLPHLETLLQHCGPVDLVVLHQANRYMLEFIRKSLKIPKDKFMYSLEQYGNTSSASIPLTLCATYSPSLDYHNTLLSGFGVGYSWGSVVLDLSQTKIHPVITA